MHAYIINNKIIGLSVDAQSSIWSPCADTAKIGDYFDESILSSSEYAEYIQKFIDQTANQKDYGNGFACASYTTSTNATWQAQAVAFISWRDQVWSYVYTEFDKMNNGQRTKPTIEEFLTELPILTWPV